MPYVRATDAVRWTVGNPIVASGVTEDGVTLTGLELHYHEDGIDLCEEVEGMAAGFNPLPDVGFVDADVAFGNGSDLVIVRTNHSRHGENPDAEPDVYLTKNSTKNITWVVGEAVHKGNKRWYGGVRYKCLTAHITETGLEPPSAPSLWQGSK